MTEAASFGGYTQYHLKSGGLELSAMELGATVTSLRFNGRETVLAYGAAEDYLGKIPYVCTVIGRYANRISKARFVLNGKEYILPANEGRNQLHGGLESFDRRVWRSEIVGDSAVRFELDSADGDNGFPGNLKAAITYSLSGEVFRMEFEGECDADTVYAPTSHLYFNLDGSGNILDSVLTIHADNYVEIDSELIPTGRLLPVNGAFDFRAPRRIGQDYDHCFALNGSHALTMSAGGVTMELHTDFPAVQIYTASGMEEPFWKNCALAVEPEFYPDSPNQPGFPSTLLKKGEKFHRYAEYRFKAE